MIKNAENNEYMNSPKLVGAARLVSEGKDQEALDMMQSEIEEHPDNGYAYYQETVLYLRYRMFGDAMNAVNQAIRCLEGDDKWLSAVYVYRGRINKGLGEGEKAVSDWKEAIRLYPEDACAFGDLAQYYNEMEDYDTSKQYCQKLIEMRSGDAWPYVELGRNEQALGNSVEARRLYEYAIKLDPQYQYAYPLLAGRCLEDKDYDGVIWNCLQSLRLENGNEPAEKLLCFSLPHEYDESILKQITDLGAQESNNAYWPNLAGNLSYYRARYSDSIPYYEESFKRGGGDVSLANMARAYMLMNKLIDARYYATKALQIDSRNDNAQGVLAHTLMYLEEYDEAIRTLEEYLPYKENDSAVHCLLADAYRFAGNREKALECAERALALAPEHPRTWYTRAKMLHDLGCTVEERSDLERVLEKAPATEYYDIVRCKALQMLGRFEDAWEEALKREPGDEISNDHLLDKANILANLDREDEAYDELKSAFDNGSIRFHELMYSPLFDKLSSIPRNFDLVAEAYTRFFAGLVQSELDRQAKEPGWGKVPFTRENSHICVKGEINGLPLKFVFDTGCCDISISSVEAAFMLKNGYLEERDLGGIQQYRTASGDFVNGTVVNLRNVSFGGKEFHDIRASIINNQDAPLLLGQSMLARFMIFSVDNESNTITFAPRTAVISSKHLSCLASLKQEYDHDYSGAAKIYGDLYDITGNSQYASNASLNYMSAMLFDKALEILDKTLDDITDYQGDDKDEQRMIFMQLKDLCFTYQQRYEESLVILRVLQQEYPDEWYHHYKEGWILNRMNRLEEAEKALMRAIQMNPDNIGSQLELGILYRMKGMEAEAQKMFESVEDIPEGGVFDFMKAEALARAGHKEKVRKLLAGFKDSSDMITHPIDLSCMYLNAALSYAIIGDLDEAEVYLQKSLEVTPVQLMSVLGSEDCEHLKKIKGYDAIVEKYLNKAE